MALLELLAAGVVPSLAYLGVGLRLLRPLGVAASGAERNLFNAIAVVATINGVLVQMIMGSRVLYGLSAQGSLPAWLGYVSPLTRTPVEYSVSSIALSRAPSRVVSSGVLRSCLT